MNRLISSLLLFFLLLVCFAGCEISDMTNEKTPTELQNQDAIVCKLIEYLQDLFTSYEVPDTSTEEKIEKIKEGTQALLVDFQNSEYYFVCAYYDTAHQNEAIDYCCVTNYTWVKFEDANEISEKYKGLNFVVGFQIDRAAFVTDILTKDISVPCVEHFQNYVPHFCAGVNTNNAIEFNVAFLYLHSTDADNLYHSVSAYDHVLKTLPCLSLSGRYYVIIDEYTIYPDGNRSDADLRSDFGKYYDLLESRMNTNRYMKTDEKGRTTFYRLIEVYIFADCIIA